jgi:hypothetical protein
MFVFTCTLQQIVALRVIYVIFSNNGYDQYSVYPGLAIVLLYGIMLTTLVFGSV